MPPTRTAKTIGNPSEVPIVARARVALSTSSYVTARRPRGLEGGRPVDVLGSKTFSQPILGRGLGPVYGALATCPCRHQRGPRFPARAGKEVDRNAQFEEEIDVLDRARGGRAGRGLVRVRGGFCITEPKPNRRDLSIKRRTGGVDIGRGDVRTKRAGAAGRRICRFSAHPGPQAKRR